VARVSLRPTSKGVTALIVVAVVCFFGCVLAYMAAAGKMRSASAELKSKEQEVAQSRKMAEELEESKLEYLDTRAQLRFLESSVSTRAYVPTLLKQLERLGKSVDLKVVAVRPQAPEKAAYQRKVSSGAQAAGGDVESASKSKNADEQKQAAKKPSVPYDELKIEVEVEGRYMNALDFLYKLTTFPKIVAVNGVQLAPVERNGAFGSPNLNIRMGVTAIVFKEEGGKPNDAG